MSISIEALAMAGVGYEEWGMDFEEWERMEMDPPPPHLHADEYEDEHDEELSMMATDTTEELCESTESKNQLTDVFDDHFIMQSPKTYTKIMHLSHGIKRLKMLVVAMMVIRFLRRQQIL
ncbi:uncharacterized protein LOC110907344 [Helianthus annuus]|uniref:uncharacterized protein LOC110907344 n=1 Tax=Helianthus annuus TaxID=4232 RepID=UPI000B902A4D|nr:uncharacterized protein LOC110907344 [Helianthus annuus]